MKLTNSRRGCVVAALVICMTTNGVAQTAPSPSSSVMPETLALQRVFHIAGIPGVKRNGRGDLVLSSKTVVFVSKNREVLIIPFSRIGRVRMVPAERHYAKATYAAVAAIGLPGALLMFKTRKVDSLAIDYENERGGHISCLIQVSKGDGARVKEWLTHFGVNVTDEFGWQTAKPQ